VPFSPIQRTETKLLSEPKGTVQSAFTFLKGEIKMELTKKTVERAAKVLAIGCLAATSVGLTACNTVEGVGEDVKATGDAVADTARDAKD